MSNVHGLELADRQEVKFVHISFAHVEFCCEVALDWFAQECAEKGEDYDIVKLRDVGADETDRIDRKRKKKNPDQGFAGKWKDPDTLFHCALFYLILSGQTSAELCCGGSAAVAQLPFRPGICGSRPLVTPY